MNARRQVVAPKKLRPTPNAAASDIATEGGMPSLPAMANSNQQASQLNSAGSGQALFT